MFRHVLGVSAGIVAATVIGFAGLSLVGRDSAKVGAPDAIFEAATERALPNAPTASGGIIIPTMSFDTRAAAYPKLATIEPGLPIKDYFDDFFPARCDYNDDTAYKRFKEEYPDSRYNFKDACRLQSAVICDARGSAGSQPQGQNQGIVLELLGEDKERHCGVVTTAHGWETFVPSKSYNQCWVSRWPTTKVLEMIGATPVQNYSTTRNVANHAQWFYAYGGGAPSTTREVTDGGSFGDAFDPRIDAERVRAVVDSMKLNLFGGTGSLTTDLQYDALPKSMCSRRTDEFFGPMVTFDEIRLLNSVDALKKTCDRGVAICASPANGAASDQKRCSFYLPSELGEEGDVYDFRQLRSGKGIVRHYGTSFKGLSGAGHYCLRKESHPIPFGMSVAVQPSPTNTDRATYNNWLSLYIMQGSRERGEYVVVQHLANLADFENFRKHQEMD